ncbi:hypothetical protein ZYGR_0N05340 [Zygosaccharomyces rouxii]|uniref:ZYRO0D12562p n=2 Tax=Zygosaccharomyces rouxii TaxID=4956 RepID=C5DW76_ZYGRC|nr:uncharacterized protein ZYRO0D12562g [Zygosaccharomyces rouxii]KAH9200954.1 5'-AMP-activated protein kinase beta subunit, interation domain-containing protein [Zygosaccharomyces rouxii]GAV49128.1 hypothetical protein ZYGR_0N05340 [Zygosaccharomyces rouxii]CAR28045.1 ZYRO0D12562p [Zygosaccharomyces rouxii]
MGNTPSAHQRVGRKGSENFQESNNSSNRYSQTKYLLEVDKGRQSSITSQLFPSRKTRHAPSGLGNLKRKTQNVVPHPPSLFKKNYSLEEASAGAQGPNNNNNDNHNVTLMAADDDPRDFNDTKTSTESVRENMAGLSIKSSNETGPMFFSPGPATPTVQPTKEEAIPPMDDNMIFHNRQSVVALKKNLEESEQPSSRSGSSANMETRTTPIDNRRLKPLPRQAVAAAITATATTAPATPNGRPSIDTDPESSDIDNISDDGYLHSKDIVLNQSLLHNVIKRDMKRKRDKETNDSNNNLVATKTLEQDGGTNNTSTNAFISKNSTLEPLGNHGNPKVHDVTINLESESPRGQSGLSYDSLELGHLQDVKKLKSIPHDMIMPHASAVGKIRPEVLQQHGKFYSMDSFEKGSVEHREVEDRNRNSSLSSLSSSPVSGSSQDVHVAIKWRDHLPVDGTNRMSMVSEDIASTLSFERQKHGARNTFPMRYEEETKEWVVPDLVLPVGVYRLQFLINGELTHSNYLPTATDSVGNFVNWFEVIPGYEKVEPYRDEVELDSGQPLNAGNNGIAGSVLSLENQGSEGTVLMEPVPGKVNVRPPLASMHHSSNRVIRSNTPYSDYTGISRSSSALRKSPINCTTSSLDLHTALQPKKYKYSNEIPELFKTAPITKANDENEDFTFGHMEPPTYDWARGHPSSNAGFGNQVVDCNQDELFTELQQGGLLDAETAEQLFLEKYPVPDLPIYLNSYYLNRIISEFQKNNYPGGGSGGINHIIPHVNLNHLLTSSIRDEMISVGCTTRYEGKFITQVIYAPCYYENGRTLH